jgi:hypothetical protein
LATGHSLNFVDNFLGWLVLDYSGAILLKGLLASPLAGLGFTELEQIVVEVEGSGEPEEEEILVAQAAPLQGGVLGFGPIVKAMLTDADFGSTHTINLVTIFDEIDIPFTTIEDEDVIEDVPVETLISISSFVVPLTDMMQRRPRNSTTTSSEDTTTSPSQEPAWST